MKYNPRVNEEVASLDGFAAAHPAAPDAAVQGTLEILYRLERMLSEVTGPGGVYAAAGGGRARRIHRHPDRRGASPREQGPPAHGDHRLDSAHGTNPASAVLGGYTVKTVASGPTAAWTWRPCRPRWGRRRRWSC